jgi:uncharacterized protein YaaQ
MKLILTIIQADDAAQTVDTLTGCGYRVTRMATQGGWLRQANVTLLIGLQDNQIDHALKVLARVAGKRSRVVDVPGDALHGIAPSEMVLETGGATVFVLDVAQHARL